MGGVKQIRYGMGSGGGERAPNAPPGSHRQRVGRPQEASGPAPGSSSELALEANYSSMRAINNEPKVVLCSVDTWEGSLAAPCKAG